MSEQQNVYVCNSCMKEKAACAEIFTEQQVIHSNVPMDELPFPKFDEALTEQHALLKINADAWFGKHIESAAQDKDQYQKLLKMKMEAHNSLQSAF